jgi:S-adenosylmethionine hydrolase
VLCVDSFGNLITNIAQELLPAGERRKEALVECKGRTIVGIQPTYDLSPPGTLVALVGSQGRLEIAAVRGSAAKVLDACEGVSVVVRWPAEQAAGAAGGN